MKNRTFDVYIYRVGRRYRLYLKYISNKRVAMEGATKYVQWRSAIKAAELLAKQCGNAVIHLPDGHTTRCR